MDLHNLLYDNMPDGPVSKGSLLVSEPIMEDAYFSRSVCFLIDITPDGGKVGLLLNKRLNCHLKDILPGFQYEGEAEVFCGGPVELDRLTLLHCLGDKLGESYEIIPGVFVGGEIEKVKEYLKAGGEVEGKLRFFLGYSGWSSGQLEDEIRRHSWAVDNSVNPEKLLEGQGLDYWSREVRKLGEACRNWLNVPLDPSFN